MRGLHAHPRMPDEMAAAVLCVCSDAASLFVGHGMFVDGGQTVP